MLQPIAVMPLVRHESLATIQINSKGALKKPCHPRPKALFCFSLVRTPPEPTAALLANQLAAACDGWALFGDTEDPANNVTKAWAKTDIDITTSDNKMGKALQGAWKHVHKSGAMDEYEWVVMVEADSFVRSSTLHKTFKALHGSCKRGGYMVSDDFIDGYFIALHAETVLGINSLGWPSDCDPVLGGHNGDLDPCLYQLGISGMGGLTDAEGNNLVAKEINHIDAGALDAWSGKPPICTDPASALLDGKQICCTAPDATQPDCVSTEFVVVHPVKSAVTYSALMKAFP